MTTSLSPSVKQTVTHNNYTPLLKAIMPLCVWLCFANSAAAQDVQAQMAAMQQEIRELRAEVDALKALVANSPAGHPNATVQANAQPEPKVATSDRGQELAANVQMLQTEVADQAQTKVESNSRWPVKLFGSILSVSSFNSSNVDSVELPSIALLPTQGSSFASSLRQTRLGVAVEGPKIGDFHSRGLVAIDFFGGAGQSLGETDIYGGIARLNYAYVRLDNASLGFEAGQDEMVLAPLTPRSIAAVARPELYRSGKLYFRTPQLRVEDHLALGTLGTLRFTAAMLSPGYSDYMTQTRRAHVATTPAVQGRIAWGSRVRPDSETSGWEIGFSGHAGRERYVSQTYNYRLNTSAASIDFNAQVQRFGVAFEGYNGWNIGNFGGALGQNGRAEGGFAELRFHLTPKWEWNGGVGADNALRVPEYLPHRNQTTYFNSIYQVTPELATSFEYRRLHSAVRSDIPSSSAIDHNLDLVFAYSF